jgi:hypothetical protein
MSPSWLVSSRVVKFAPGPAVDVVTMFPPSNRSMALVVITVPELLDPLIPAEAAVTSTGLAESIPLYSKTRMFGYAAGCENVTVTGFVPAEMLLA